MFNRKNYGKRRPQAPPKGGRLYSQERSPRFLPEIDAVWKALTSGIFKQGIHTLHQAALLDFWMRATNNSDGSESWFGECVASGLMSRSDDHESRVIMQMPENDNRIIKLIHCCTSIVSWCVHVLSCPRFCSTFLPWTVHSLLIPRKTTELSQKVES